MNKNKILLVDDELNLTETITELLIYQNYEVVSASNGQHALDILNNWTPDLIISDIMMPTMDGYMFHEIIRENKILSSIPFIFLSAKKENNQMRDCLLNGADDYLSKPFKINELLQTIEVKINRFENIKNAYPNFNFNANYNLGQEINSPILNILDSINLLIENEDIDKKEIKEIYNSIKISGESLNRTMLNLALYQNLKNNSLIFLEDCYSFIYDAFLKVKEELSKTYEKDGKRIYFSIDESELKISQPHLHFILFELMDNALKFSEDDKKIIISGIQYNSEYYELVIRDFGIGFKEDELKKIDAHQKFNGEEKNQQGLGLGLFLSKTVIKKAKGVFSIISKKNQGTTIKLFLPIKVEKACV